MYLTWFLDLRTVSGRVYISNLLIVAFIIFIHSSETVRCELPRLALIYPDKCNCYFQFGDSVHSFVSIYYAQFFSSLVLSSVEKNVKLTCNL